MNSADQQQSTALSFNGRTSRFERENAGSNPAGAASKFIDEDRIGYIAEQRLRPFPTTPAR